MFLVQVTQLQPIWSCIIVDRKLIAVDPFMIESPLIIVVLTGMGFDDE